MKFETASQILNFVGSFKDVLSTFPQFDIYCPNAQMVLLGFLHRREPDKDVISDFEELKGWALSNIGAAGGKRTSLFWAKDISYNRLGFLSVSLEDIRLSYQESSYLMNTRDFRAELLTTYYAAKTNELVVAQYPQHSLRNFRSSFYIDFAIPVLGKNNPPFPYTDRICYITPEQLEPTLDLLASIKTELDISSEVLVQGLFLEDFYKGFHGNFYVNEDPDSYGDFSGRYYPHKISTPTIVLYLKDFPSLKVYLFSPNTYLMDERATWYHRVVKPEIRLKIQPDEKEWQAFLSFIRDQKTVFLERQSGIFYCDGKHKRIWSGFSRLEVDDSEIGEDSLLQPLPYKTEFFPVKKPDEIEVAYDGRVISWFGKNTWCFSPEEKS